MRTIAAASLALLMMSASAKAQMPPPMQEAPPPAGKASDVEPRPPGPSKSARFRLQVGRIFLGMTCPDDEPLKACSDFAMQLLDKAETMQKR